MFTNGKRLEDTLKFVYYLVCISNQERKALNEASNYEETF